METKLKSKPIDFELCALLGDKPADFLVLCFDGVQLDFFGTPYDSPKERIMREGLVDRLNDRSTETLWPEMWANWKPQICRQFQLPKDATDETYRPVVNCEISRVCHGYSEHLHAAIGLFERAPVKRWSIIQDVNCRVTAEDKHGRTFEGAGNNMALVISESVLELLKANLANGESSNRDQTTRPK